MSKTGISRRRFLKVGLSSFAGVAVGLGASPKTGAFKDIRGVSRTSLKSLRAIPTTCEQCPAGCGIIAYLDGDRLVQILGNPEHPNNQGGICAKGLAGINLVNDPERLLYPMKRLGSRGDGRWTRITWDEVYATLAERIKKMHSEKRLNECVFDKGADDPFLDEFMAALKPARVIDRQALKNLNRDAAYLSMVGSPFLIEDIGKSRTILNFGANPYANHDFFIGIARRLVLNQVEKGARLYTFDVRMSETAARSEAWFPIRAGTDGIVALAMAKVIVDKGLADKNFLEQRTNAPLSVIRNHLKPYTLEMAEKESGVSAADMERLAIEFASQKPSVAMAGGGLFDHENGTQNVRCVALLNWIVGNLGQEGGLFFPRAYDVFLKKSPSLKDEGLMDLCPASEPVDTYFAWLSNPAYEEPDCKSAAGCLKDEKIIPFLVVMDTHLTETAMLADLVLPAATYLEGWNLSPATSLDGYPLVNLRQPVVSLLSPAQVLRSPAFDVGKLLEPSFQPRGESQEAGNFCLEMARRLGGSLGEKFPYKDTVEYLEETIQAISGLKKAGGLEMIKEQGFWADGAKGEEKEKRFQKVKVYSDSAKQRGHSPLPQYMAVAGHGQKKDGEFILTAFKSNLESKGTANSKWAKEILHENRLWMNDKAAKKLNLKNGDKVRVTSSVGTLITRVLVTGRIHPDSVAIAEGSGHTAVGHVAKALKFKSKDRDTDLIWWSQKGNGVNPMEVIERRIDPMGRGLGLKDTVVRVEKM